MKRRIFIKIISLILIQAFLLLEVGWCGKVFVFDEKTTVGTLAPSVQIGESSIKAIFQDVSNEQKILEDVDFSGQEQLIHEVNENAILIYDIDNHTALSGSVLMYKKDVIWAKESILFEKFTPRVRGLSGCALVTIKLEKFICFMHLFNNNDRKMITKIFKKISKRLEKLAGSLEGAEAEVIFSDFTFKESPYHKTVNNYRPFAKAIINNLEKITGAKGINTIVKKGKIKNIRFNLAARKRHSENQGWLINNPSKFSLAEQLDLIKIQSLKDKGYIGKRKKTVVDFLEKKLKSKNEKIKELTAKTIIEEVIGDEYVDLRLKALEIILPIILPKTKLNRPSEAQVDLHTHTYRSDGYDTPTAQILRAYVEGLRAIAVSDHYQLPDRELIEATEILNKAIDAQNKIDNKNRHNLQLIAGIELFGIYGERWTEVHIVCIFPEYDLEKKKAIEKELKEMMDLDLEIMQKRMGRMRKWINKRFAGLKNISEGNLKNAVRYRPNGLDVARALWLRNRQFLKDKNMTTLRQIYDEYVAQESFNTKEMIKTNYERFEKVVKKVSKLGGKILIAHPNEIIRQKDGEFENILETLAQMAIDEEINLESILGVAYYSHKLAKSGHQEKVGDYIDWLNSNHPFYKRFNLLKLPESDSHGIYSPNLPLGTRENYSKDPNYTQMVLDEVTSSLGFTPIEKERLVEVKDEIYVSSLIEKLKSGKVKEWMTKDYTPGTSLMKDAPLTGGASKRGKIEQAIRHLKLATDNPKIQQDVERLLGILEKHPEADNLTLLQFEGIAHLIVKQKTGNPHAYYEYKKRLDKAYSEIYPTLRKKVLRIKNKDKQLRTALLYAGIANLIDPSHPEALKKVADDLRIEIDISKEIPPEKLLQLVEGVYERIESKGYIIGEEDTEKFINLIKSIPQGRILYFVDNHGEIIIDQLVIEVLLIKGYDVVVIARGEEVRDDVTVDEAKVLLEANAQLKKFIDAGKLKILTDGSYLLGADLLQAGNHPEFLDIWQKSTAFISKGAGNFQTLLGQRLSLPGLFIRMMKKSENAYKTLSQVKKKDISSKSPYDIAFIYQKFDETSYMLMLYQLGIIDKVPEGITNDPAKDSGDKEASQNPRPTGKITDQKLAQGLIEQSI